jgi:Cellulase (glycosyl hydrolase family 5)
VTTTHGTRRALRRIFLAMCLLLIVLCRRIHGQEQRWTKEQANQWYQQQPWIVGANYVPADAVNTLEMWQADTFDSAEIDRELGWAEGLGMNTMRVFLHNLLWEQDSQGFLHRIDEFLAIARKHHIRVMFVLLDSCFDPDPKLGPQRPPIPGVHNSGWVQAPGRAILEDPKQYPRLKAYVQGVVRAFAKDPRVLAWDVWNEPDNMNKKQYGEVELPNKRELVQALLPQVFDWARSVHPVQPLTSAIFGRDWSLQTMSPVERIQVEMSDILTFHNYGWPEVFESEVHSLDSFHRPLICTEYMARGAGSTFDTILPIAKQYHVGAINWGLVKGKTQTYLPWDSWQRPYVLQQPTIWFHDVFYPDGTPYRHSEADLIRELTCKH